MAGGSSVRVGVWGIVHAAAVDAAVGEVAAVLEGVLVVGAPAMARSGPAGTARQVVAHGGRGNVTVLHDVGATTAGRTLAAGLRALPASADVVVWFGDTTPRAATVTALAGELGSRDAVVTGTPVSDAVKRVRDGLIVGGVERDGLCRPAPPLAVAGSGPLGCLLVALDAGHDPAAALAIAGCTVHVVAAPCAA
jgi:hypothetical protein